MRVVGMHVHAHAHVRVVSVGVGVSSKMMTRAIMLQNATTNLIR